MTKEEKIIKVLSRQIELARCCKEVFAQSGDYQMAETYRVRKSVLCEVLNYIKDEEHLENMLKIIEDTMYERI